MLQIIEYLKIHSLLELYNDHGIRHRFDKNHTKFTLNYDQILSKNGDPIVEECRGLILRPHNHNIDENDIVGDCDVVAFPMKRFYNYGDIYCSIIDHKSLSIFTKLDGTCCILYYDEYFNEWLVGTRSVPEADLPICLNDIILQDKTFSTLFWEGFDNVCRDYNIDKISLLQNFDKKITYVFELTSIHNKVVVEYDKTYVTLIAMRNKITGIELSVQNNKFFPVIPTVWNLDIFEQIKTFVDTFSPNEFEGFVLCDKNFNRIKIKNSKYVLAAHLKDSTINSTRNLLRAILNNTIDDIIPLCNTELQNKILNLQEKTKQFIYKSQQKFDTWNLNATNDKEFALFVVNNTPISGIFFAARKQHKSIIEIIQNLIQQNKFTDSLCDKIYDYIKIFNL